MSLEEYLKQNPEALEAYWQQNPDALAAAIQMDPSAFGSLAPTATTQVQPETSWWQGDTFTGANDDGSQWRLWDPTTNEYVLKSTDNYREYNPSNGLTSYYLNGNGDYVLGMTPPEEMPYDYNPEVGLYQQGYKAPFYPNPYATGMASDGGQVYGPEGGGTLAENPQPIPEGYNADGSPDMDYWWGKYRDTLPTGGDAGANPTDPTGGTGTDGTGGVPTDPITGAPIDPATGVPPTGLIGSEEALGAGLTASEGALGSALAGSTEALRSGLSGGLSALSDGTDMARGDIEAARDAGLANLDPYINAGEGASNLQAALSGALGPEAQQQAYDNYLQSPGQQYLIDQSEKALTRNAAATGGLQGGNVLKALQENATGLAAQDFQNSFNRLGSLSDRGLTASQFGAGISQQAGQSLADIAQGSGLAASKMAYDTGGALSGLRQGYGDNLAGLYTNAAQNLSAGRTRAGEAIAGNVQDTTSNLANLQYQSGGDLSDAVGSSSSNLANALMGAGQADSQTLQQLATLLANISTGSGSQVSGLPSLGSTTYEPGLWEKFWGPFG